MTPSTSPRAVDVMLLDTASLYYRSFYALPSSMTAPDGFPHNAVRGLLSTIERLRGRFAPRALIAAWDTDWRPDWRVELLPTYKTHRLASTEEGEEEQPDDLGPQIGAIHRILTTWGIPVVGVQGYEADDVIGTLAPRASDMGASVVVITGDRDLVQLVDDQVGVVLTVKGGLEAWPTLDRAAVLERFGVHPEQYVDMAALRGDPSDGLPGVRGVGEKTAVRLLQHFGSLEALQTACNSSHFDKPLTPRIAASVLEATDYLTSAVAVSRLRRDVPIDDEQRLLTEAIPTSPVLEREWNEAVEEWGVRRFAEGAMNPQLAPGS